MGVTFSPSVKHILKHCMSLGPENTVYYDTTGYCELCRAFIAIVSFSKGKKKNNPFIAPPNPLFINDLEGYDVVIIKK